MQFTAVVTFTLAIFAGAAFANDKTVTLTANLAPRSEATAMPSAA
jgi:hypothetical protein